MKATDIIRRSLRSLVQAKARTFLTALAIAVGAFTLTLALAIGEGTRQYAGTIISSNIDPSKLLVSKDDNIFGQNGQTTGPSEYSEDNGDFNGQTVTRLTEADLEKIRGLDGVGSVEPQYNLRPQFVTREGQKKYTATIEAGQQRGVNIKAGELPENGPAKGRAVLPDSYIGPLGLGSAEQALGKKITVQLQRPRDVSSDEIQRLLRTEGPDALENLDPFETKQVSYTISAVSQRETTTLEQTDNLRISEADARSINDYATKDTDDYRKYVAALVQTESGTSDQASIEALQARVSGAGYTALSAEDAQSFLFQIVGVLQGIVAGFGVLALIASVFGIINTQYISVLERTSQIGLMKALGMKRFDVGTLFRFEAALIGLLGGLIGAGGAVLGGTVANPAITEALGLEAGTDLLIFQPLPVAGLIVLLMIVAVLAGLLPARKAAKLDPIEALRTE